MRLYLVILLERCMADIAETKSIIHLTFFDPVTTSRELVRNAGCAYRWNTRGVYVSLKYLCRKCSSSDRLGLYCRESRRAGNTGERVEDSRLCTAFSAIVPCPEDALTTACPAEAGSGQTQGILSFTHPWHRGLRSLHFFRRVLPERSCKGLKIGIHMAVYIHVKHPVFVLSRGRGFGRGGGLWTRALSCCIG